MESVLVLGGGGVLGYAWECGMMAGFAETADPFAFDAYLGTSAGAIAGAQLASGRLPEHAADPERRRVPVYGDFDMQVLGKIFGIWGRMDRTTVAQAAAIGAIARDVARDKESLWIESMADMVHVRDWPDKALLIAAVDTATGERSTLDRSCGAELARAVAASAAVPGMFPSVDVGGRLYMDGQVHSSTNADLLLPYRPRRVTLLVPTNVVSGGGIGGHADRMLNAEVEMLRAAGCEVTVKTPSADDMRRIGGYGLMDASCAAAAYKVGLERGREWGKEP